MEKVMLRVHSADLHDHVAQEIGECLETGDKLDLFVNKKYSFHFFGSIEFLPNGISKNKLKTCLIGIRIHDNSEAECDLVITVGTNTPNTCNKLDRFTNLLVTALVFPSSVDPQ